VLALVAGAFEALFTPLIGTHLVKGRIAELERLYQAVSRWTLMLSAPLCACIVLFAGEILGLYGMDFKAGTASLIILALGQLAQSVSGGAHWILLISGRSKLVMGNTVTGGVCLVALNAVTIPRFGMVGAAVATTGCLVLMSVVRTIEVWKLFRVHPFSMGLFKSGLAAFLAAWASLGLKLWLPQVSLVTLGVVFAITYAALLVLGLAEEDREILATVSSSRETITSPEAASSAR
jgi:O-antigen/teichoic acid export membrane protein